MIKQKESLHGRNIFFLDYDGVLHPDMVYRTPKQGIVLRCPGHSLFEYADLLAENLSMYSDIDVVLSTSWVREVSFNRALSKLPQSIQEKVIGSTYHSQIKRQFNDMSRFNQIMSFVKRHDVTNWVALDNDDHMWPSDFRRHLILTPDMEGLGNDDSLADLAEKLKSLSRINQHKP